MDDLGNRTKLPPKRAPFFFDIVDFPVMIWIAVQGKIALVTSSLADGRS